LARKPLYACSFCGLYFTRRYNANRHNQNLHYNKANIVTFSEYIVGRTCGKYLPGNPSLYGPKNKNMTKSSIVHQHENNTNLNQQKYVLHSTKTNRIGNSVDKIESVSNQLDIEKYFDNLERAKETRRKREIDDLISEIGTMLCDFYHPEYVQARVTEFRRRFDTTADYTSLYRELYNYRTSLVDRVFARPNWSGT
jgi:hypothetical protein